MRIDKDFIVATLDDSASISDKQKASQYKDLTEFFIRYRYSDVILQGTTIDDILEQASFYNKKYFEDNISEITEVLLTDYI